MTLSRAITLINTDNSNKDRYEYIVEPNEENNYTSFLTSIPEVIVVSTEENYDPTLEELFS